MKVTSNERGELMAKKGRETWVDFAKITAAFLVVILHTCCFGIKEGQIFNDSYLYYLGTYSIPIFFMVNGYLQLRKEKITYGYVKKKYISIIKISLIWNIPYCIFKIYKTKKYTSLIYSTFLSFLQKGYFFQFWFLFALILIYLILPFLNRLLNQKTKIFYIISVLFIIVCVLIDCTNIFINNYFGLSIKNLIIQPFRIWTWLCYFCLGGCLSKINNNNFNKKIHLVLTILLVGITTIYQILLSMKLYGNLYAENFYDSFLVIITSVFIFTYIKKIDLKKINVISNISNLMMGVYIIHPTIIRCFNKILVIHNNYENLLIAIGIFLISMLISYIISRIPKIKNLIKI